MRKMPAQKPGRSKQDYATPDDFLKAVLEKFKLVQFDWDLAADETNFVAHDWYGYHGSELVDAFSHDWAVLQGHLWLNPPFGDIYPWAEKCSQSMHSGLLRRIYLLTPASTGSWWFQEQIFGKARVFFLSPRLSFDGKAPYPKDCILSVYGLEPGFECWRWRE